LKPGLEVQHHGEQANVLYALLFLLGQLELSFKNQNLDNYIRSLPSILPGAVQLEL